MSYASGWAAINLDMPPKVPRCEYSAEFHWPLIHQVTGIDIHENSTPEEKLRASQAFRRAWDYSFNWSILINSQVFGEIRTRMGHANYQADGVDFDKRDLFAL